MSMFPLLIVLLLMCSVGYWYGSKKALSGVKGSSKFITSRPQQFGIYVVVWGLLPPGLLGIIWAVVHTAGLDQSSPLIEAVDKTVFPVVVMIAAAASLYLAVARINRDLRVRKTLEYIIYAILIVASLFSILTTVGIIVSLLFETIQFFGKEPRK